MKASFWIREKVFLEDSNNPYYAMILSGAKSAPPIWRAYNLMRFEIHSINPICAVLNMILYPAIGNTHAQFSMKLLFVSGTIYDAFR